MCLFLNRISKKRHPLNNSPLLPMNRMPQPSPHSRNANLRRFTPRPPHYPRTNTRKRDTLHPQPKRFFHTPSIAIRQLLSQKWHEAFSSSDVVWPIYMDDIITVR
jgi:hypothetical protein